MDIKIKSGYFQYKFALHQITDYSFIENFNILEYVTVMAILSIIPNSFKIEKSNITKEFINEILDLCSSHNYKIQNITIHISLQKPKLYNNKNLLKDNLCKLFNTNNINIQAGTGENIGCIGNSKAMMIFCTVNMNTKSLIGFGYDRHRFNNDGNYLIICGQRIDYHKSVDAHSDGDVVLHALTNAILSAIGKGDIGDHFPDNCQKWKNAESQQFITHAMKMISKYKIENIVIQIIVSDNLEKILNNKEFKANSLKLISNLCKTNYCNISITKANAGCIARDEGLDSNVIINIQDI